MKRCTALILAMGMTLALAACGGKNANSGSSDAGKSSAAGTEQAGGAGNADESKSGMDESKNGTENTGSGGELTEITDASALLAAIWALHGEDEKFAAMGGDEKNMTQDAPGNYGLENTASLDATLRFPESAVSMIDGAASLIHMMNANTFTCGAFHVSDPADISKVADALKENILSTQWMCGFPEKLIVISVEDYIISAFGNGELIDAFRDKTFAAFPSAVMLHEQAIE